MAGPRLKEGTPPYSLSEFLDRHYQGGELLLGLSGGPDSLSLFHSLLALKKPCVVLHVNHGLREESEQEERSLKVMCEKHHIPFILKRLSLQHGSNLEARARTERFAFFEEVFDERSSEALILGHHADDQVETLLKRLFEGASLPKWEGIAEISLWREKVPVWRPLLKLRKKEILSWLDEMDIVSFEDNTNMSDQNLRGKFRGTVLPYLSTTFGKEIVPAFIQHQKDILECLELFDELTAVYDTEKIPFHIPPIHKALQKHLIRKFLSTHELTLSAATLESLINSIPLNGLRSFSTQKGKLISLSNKKIFFD